MIDFTIQVAGYIVSVRAMFDSTKAFCGKYLCAGEPQFHIEITPEALHLELQAFLQEAEVEGLPQQAPTEPYLETLALQRKLTELLLPHNILLFHGSAVAVDGNAYLFVAKSGTGKSTHTALWRQLLGDRAVMVNDDKPFLEITETGVLVHGSPWNGVHKLGSNISVPLKAICILERSEENVIRQISAKDSIYMLLQQSSHPKTSAPLAKYMDLVDAITKNVSFYRLSCNTDIEAAHIAYTAMSK